MSEDCAYCGSDAAEHDPVYVSEGSGRERAGAFCNYACLAAHIEREELADGACCRWEPS